jgi:hypothetical protein
MRGAVRQVKTWIEGLEQERITFQHGQSLSSYARQRGTGRTSRGARLSTEISTGSSYHLLRFRSTTRWSLKPCPRRSQWA